MKKLYLSLLLILAGLTISNAQNFNFAKKFGGTSSDYGNVVKKDLNGNIIVVGGYSGTIDLDPGSGTFNVTSVGNQDFFVVKLDQNGNFIWGKSAGGLNADNANDFVVDSSGDIYLCGFFRGTADFDPSSATTTLSTISGGISADGFILKLSSSGNFMYVKQVGGSSAVDDHVLSLDIDNQNNLYATGYFNGNCDLDPGVGQFNVSSVGSSDIFIIKLNSIGNFVFGRTVGGTSGTTVSGGSCGRSIKVSSSNILVTGYFDGTQDFNPGTGVFNLTSNGQFDCFVLKLDLSGNFIFAKSFGGIGNDDSYSVGYDANDNIYLCGLFNSTVDFDPSAGTSSFTSSGLIDGFLLKLNNLGNYQWCNRIGGTGNDFSYGLALDAYNNIFITGYFSSSVDFDNTASQLLLTSNGLKDIYVAGYNSSGTIIYAQNYGSTSDDEGYGIASSGSEIYLTGYFQNTVDFDGGTNVSNLTSSGIQDAFVLKLTNSFCTQTVTNVVTVYDTITTTIYDTITTTIYDTITTSIAVTDTLIINAVLSGVNPPNNTNTLLVYPNPARTHITIDNGNFALMNGYTVRINNALGQTVLTQAVNQQQFFIDLSTWTGNGLYYLDLIDNSGNSVETKVIVVQ